MTASPAERLPPRPIPGGRRFAGRVEPPPSKSLTNRHLVLALLARRPVVIERPLVSEDTDALAAALETLGFTLRRGRGELAIEPPARPAREAAIDCRASGTMARFLTAALAALPGRFRLDGGARLRERPLGPLATALETLGARFAWEGRRGHLPVTVAGGTLRGGEVELDAGLSSQFLSALLMAALGALDEVRVRVRALTSAPYVELTLRAMAEWGGRVESEGEGYRVVPGITPPRRLRVPGDDSSACYPAAAAALTGGEARLAGLARESAHPDRRFFALLEEMGARCEWLGQELLVRGTGALRAVDADLSEMPDQVPTLAVLAPFARGTTVIRNVAHLRLKESDRLAAVAAGLESAGARASVAADGLTIPGLWAHRPPPGRPALVETFGDHRIAMSFALLGLVRPGLSVADPGVVEKSYPGFWRDFAACTGSGA
ncbi:MAG: 3-phosphoshikimate 1-carboxyvinyltransferase [Thermoanaerobaculia bacterium]|nr:3-phosphoshikimate 1-carboxyvinyltransferase [Thermoanaerobaculia bacterium]